MSVASEYSTQERAFRVDGMNCASCVAHVRKSALSVAGVESADVNLARGRAVIKFHPQQTTPSAIESAISSGGYAASLEESADAAAAEQQRLDAQMHHARGWFRRALLGVILWLPLELTHWTLTVLHGGTHAEHQHADGMTFATLLSSSLAMIFVGSAFYQSAWAALRHRTSNMDTLIALGASVAWLYSAVALSGFLLGFWHPLPTLYFMEASGLLALISIGHWLEAHARQSAGSAIRQLLELAPAQAHRLDEDDKIEPVAVSQLLVGDRVLVRPGDRVPIDGVVVAGPSSVDESMISGEPLPIRRDKGDKVIGGTQNLDGRLIIRVTQIGADTALAQIVKLVEQAQASRPAIQQLADRIAAVFVPSVLGVALLTGIVWLIIGLAQQLSAAAIAGKIALCVCSVLIIACPCALGLAVPAALMVGTGRGAKKGILLRDIDALQRAEQIDTIVLDKTGTITAGKPTIESIEVLDHSTNQAEALSIAAALERFSEHPIARAFTAAAKDQADVTKLTPDEFSIIPGGGVRGTINGKNHLLGSAALLAEHGLPIASDSSTTAVYLAELKQKQFTDDRPLRSNEPRSAPSSGPLSSVRGGEGQREGEHARSTTNAHDLRNLSSPTPAHLDDTEPDRTPFRVGTVLARFTLSDQLKPHSLTAIRDLHALGLKIIMLSGDNPSAARAIANQVNIDDARGNLRPADKAAEIRKFQAQHKVVAMVGDGINDAPALAAANLAIAVGSGTDIAKQASDIVLVGGSLVGVASAIRLSRATMRSIRTNLFFAFAYNVLAIPLAACGLLNPLIAAAAMALSDLTVLGNALRLRHTKID